MTASEMEFFGCLNVLWMEEDGGGNTLHRPGGNRELCNQKRANATVSKMAALRWQVQLSRREDRCGGGERRGTGPDASSREL